MNSTPVGQAAKEEINALIQEVVWLLGLKARPEDEQAVKLQILNMTAYLVKYYKSTGLREVSEAYGLYVAGELDIEPIRQLDPIDFNKVMKAYRKHRGKILHPLIEGQKLLEEPKKREPTEAEIDAYMAHCIKRVFQDLLDGRPVDDLGNAMYDWLDKKKLVPFTPERKRIIFEQAKLDLQNRSENASRSLNLNSAQRADAKKLAELYRGAIEQNQSLNGGPQEAAKRHAKQLAFVSLLNDWIEAGVTPVELIGEETDSAEGFSSATIVE